MAITTHWTSPPQDLRYSLESGTVHVWRASLDASPGRVSRYRSYLSQDELARADRFRMPHPHYQFIITRGILRMLLSRYTGVLPAQLHFETQAQGKPFLMTASSFPIQFNVAHTREMALIALTFQHAVGIDVEWIDRKIHDRDIAKRYFSPGESAYLASLASTVRTHQFFWYWTGKEAYLKMQGKGISEGLAQCELTIDPDQFKVGISHPNKNGQEEDCSLYRITCGSEHVGAVAVACLSARVSYWNWREEDPAKGLGTLHS